MKNPAEPEPGAWNTYEIEAAGERVTIRTKRPDGESSHRLRSHARPICLTAEGDECHFGNVTIEGRP